MKKIVFAFAFALCAACSGTTTPSNNTASPDMAKAKPADMAMLNSECGHPGDTGNSLGIGLFCKVSDDCANTKANTFCSSLGNDGTHDTYFCTLLCKLDGGAAQCGENATCECGSGGGMTACACTPNSCLGPSDGGK